MSILKVLSLCILGVMLFASGIVNATGCEPLSVFEGENVNDKFGFWVSGAGDMDGDSIPDYIVSSFGYDNKTGRVYVFSGYDGDTLWVITGENEEDEFGFVANGAGDVNGDGLADLVICAHKYDSDSLTNAGRIYLFLGRDETSPLYLPADSADMIATGENSGDHLGHSVNAAGDFNGDGYDDIVVGEPNWDDTTLTSGTDCGRVLIILGDSVLSDSVLLSDAYFTVNGTDSTSAMGWSVSTAGDLDGDGFYDIVFGSYLDKVGSDFQAGKVYVFYGDSRSTSTVDADDADHTYTGVGNFGYLGWSVSYAGDVNGDDTGDIIISTFTYAGSHTSSPYAGIGIAYVYSGSDLDDTLYVITGDTSNYYDFLGYDVSGAGDFNGDGYDDILIARNEINVVGDYRAIAEIYSGIDGSVLMQFKGGTIVDGSGRGLSVATLGDLSGDGYDYVIVGSPADDSAAGTAKIYSIQYPDDCCCVGKAGNVNSDPNDEVTIADITALIAYSQSPYDPLCCFEEADINGNGEVHLVEDGTILINYLFNNGSLPDCTCPE